ncbi:hypothetical protein C8F01DRAFT_1247545 [Mycena amicta]|nr:hypothetical protein C8F01DRAFT_1247545 [Mycena amicta]
MAAQDQHQDSGSVAGEDLADQDQDSVAARTTTSTTITSQDQPHVREEMNIYNQPWNTYTHETQLYKPFIELANYCIGTKTNLRFGRNDPIIVLGSNAPRKPDVVSVWNAALTLRNFDVNTLSDLKEPGPRGKPFHWRDLLTFWEFKHVPKGGTFLHLDSSGLSPNRTSASEEGADNLLPPPAIALREVKKAALAQPDDDQTSRENENPRTQCASYALELLTYGGLRSHVIGALITNNFIEMIYYDRSIIVKSEAFDFIALLTAVATLSEWQWGYFPLLPAPKYIPSMRYEPGVLVSPFGEQVITLNGGRELTLNETIFQSHGIIGRGTCVSRAKMKEGGKNTDVIVKWSWPAKTRKPEAEFIKHATDKARVNGDPWVLDHLPKILHSETKEFKEGTPQRHLATHFKDDYELRELRLIVQEELHPITELTDADELREAFRGIFRCYEWLYNVAEIMHRDISRNNLMYRKMNGKIYGVLNDFDLAVFRNDPQPSTSKQRTGTKPYMAADLLVPGPPPPHLYRFDLESLYYVFLHIVCQYHDGKKIDKPPFDAWDHLPITLLRLAKRELILSAMRVSPTLNFLNLRVLIMDLHAMFKDGYNAREKAEDIRLRRQLVPTDADEDDFDEETLGGNITFEKFAQILDPKSQ